MSQEIIQNIRNTRLARKAQASSGIYDQIKSLQRKIVTNSLSSNFDLEKHRLMMNQLKVLKDDFKRIGMLSKKCI